MCIFLFFVFLFLVFVFIAFQKVHMLTNSGYCPRLVVAAVGSLPPRQLDQLPRPHNAMNGIRQDAQMMMMITIIQTSSKQLVYQSDPDPTQLINLNKTIWTQLRYLLLCS